TRVVDGDRRREAARRGARGVARGGELDPVGGGELLGQQTARGDREPPDRPLEPVGRQLRRVVQVDGRAAPDEGGARRRPGRIPRRRGEADAVGGLVERRGAAGCEGEQEAGWTGGRLGG